MVCKKLTPNLMVEEVNRTVDFYSKVLGFNFVMGVPEKSQEVVTIWQKERLLDYALMKCGNAEIMFQARKSITEEISEFKDKGIGGSLTFYIEVDNVNELYEKIKDKVSIVKDPEIKFYGMKEFYIHDCNGYILGFAEMIN